MTENKSKAKLEINLPELKFNIKKNNIKRLILKEKMSTERFPGLTFHTTLKSQETSRDHPQGYHKVL